MTEQEQTTVVAAYNRHASPVEAAGYVFDARAVTSHDVPMDKVEEVRAAVEAHEQLEASQPGADIPADAQGPPPTDATGATEAPEAPEPAETPDQPAGPEASTEGTGEAAGSESGQTPSTSRRRSRKGDGDGGDAGSISSGE